MCLYGLKKISLILTLFFSTLYLNAATIDTISIYSNAMHKSFKCVVIKPKTYTAKHKFPVVYLLHGYSGNQTDWILKVPQIKNYADEYNMMIVCPDGGYSSWYFDSPLDSTMKFETYISTEVPNYIDKHYSTIANRKGRAITGLSMGGHGALYLAFKHSNFFGACGSMSGGVDIRPFTKKWDISKQLGDSAHYSQNWNDNTVVNVVEKYRTDSLAIIFDCGTDDFFYGVNKALHQKLLQLVIAHDYIERPGDHSWPYWSNAIGYQLLYFKKYFDKK